jgi:pyrimidine operon attenuation protein / uracil phosphoribosyltransferase
MLHVLYLLLKNSFIMRQRLLLDSKVLEVTLSRLCMQLLENHGDFSNSVIIGLQPRGAKLAERIASRLSALLGYRVNMGLLDATFFRDDFRRRELPLQPNITKIPFLVEDKKVILVDDVLYTGRSVRAALDALQAYGRPAKVELLALVERKYTRELPVEGQYIGLTVNSIRSERVFVKWADENGQNQDEIWLLGESLPEPYPMNS